jgi:membrane-associated phospholipid phosphatase
MLWIFIILIYHLFILHPIEKIFCNYYLNSSITKRPNGNMNGMPSGHVQITSLCLFLLYFYHELSIYICLVGVILMGIQRMICKMHTLFQVLVSIILGFIYAYIYSYDLLYGFIGVLLLTNLLYVCIII